MCACTPTLLPHKPPPPPCLRQVLVVDTQHSRRAMFGELFATEAKRKGLAAVIVEGGVRDVDSIRQLDMPVYARFITPMAGSSYKLSSTQVRFCVCLTPKMSFTPLGPV